MKIDMWIHKTYSWQSLPPSTTTHWWLTIVGNIVGKTPLIYYVRCWKMGVRWVEVVRTNYCEVSRLLKGSCRRFKLNLPTVQCITIY